PVGGHGATADGAERDRGHRGSARTAPRAPGGFLRRRAPDRARSRRTAARARGPPATSSQRWHLCAPYTASRARHRRRRRCLADRAVGRRMRRGADRPRGGRPDAGPRHRGRSITAGAAGDGPADRAGRRARGRGGTSDQRPARVRRIPPSSRSRPDPAHADDRARARADLISRRSRSVAKQVLSFTVNDEPIEVLVQPYVTLLDALREDLALTGPKEGCGTGDCGACTVHLDGKPVASCLMLAMQARGRAVRTIEGLGRLDALHALQDAFVRHGVPQCGFCIPGVLMAATALLAENSRPTNDEIRYGIAANLCRCTRYPPLVAPIPPTPAAT